MARYAVRTRYEWTGRGWACECTTKVNGRTVSGVGSGKLKRFAKSRAVEDLERQIRKAGG